MYNINNANSGNFRKCAPHQEELSTQKLMYYRRHQLPFPFCVWICTLLLSILSSLTSLNLKKKILLINSTLNVNHCSTTDLTPCVNLITSDPVYTSTASETQSGPRQTLTFPAHTRHDAMPSATKEGSGNLASVSWVRDFRITLGWLLFVFQWNSFAVSIQDCLLPIIFTFYSCRCRRFKPCGNLMVVGKASNRRFSSGLGTY